ncbi:MAG: HlyD family efflux transporter periplasmic adaptor subunit [Planctomycetota bacterium]
MKVITCLIALLVAGQAAAQTDRYTTPDGNPVLQATIFVKDEARIPAVEPGMLIEMNVREGSSVKEGDVLARIDDRKAKAAVKVTRYAEQAAKKRAAQDIEKRYAQAAAAVAKVEWEQGLESNRQHKGAVVESEIRRMKLDYERANLQIEKAVNDQYLAGLDANTKTAEREAAQMELDWRTIRAPFDGDVVMTNVHQSEWVNPGDPILKLMRFDTLYVQGRVRSDQFDRSEVYGKPVTVEVTKARGRKATVEGRIVHADQLLQHTGVYTVRAEVVNQQVNGSWLLQPGGVASMTIHVDQKSQESSAQSLEANKVRR